MLNNTIILEISLLVLFKFFDIVLFMSGENKKRIERVLEIRRSSASGPIKSAKKYDRKKSKKESLEEDEKE